MLDSTAGNAFKLELVPILFFSFMTKLLNSFGAFFINQNDLYLSNVSADVGIRLVLCSKLNLYHVDVQTREPLPKGKAQYG